MIMLKILIAAIIVICCLPVVLVILEEDTTVRARINSFIGLDIAAIIIVLVFAV